jgi:ankyrin repeat protein
VRSLLELGANVNNRSLGKAALHQAANYDELEIMKLLLAAGADPNLPEEDAWRPLWVVRSREAAQILLDAGASTSAMDDIGYTAYEFHKDADIRALLRRR